MTQFRLLLSGLLLTSTMTMSGQGAKNIRINEVLTNNTASIVDEFGNREAWIELENTSFTTYNIRGMYFTTDRSVLDPKMSVPERIKRMSAIPSGDPRTQIGGSAAPCILRQLKSHAGKVASLTAYPYV